MSTMTISSIVLLMLTTLSHSLGLATFRQRKMDLVTNISPTMRVEEGGSADMECWLGNIPDKAEVAWVRILGVREVEYLSIYAKEDGVVDYDEEQFISAMEENPEGGLVWSLTISKVTNNMAGLYQCQVCSVVVKQSNSNPTRAWPSSAPACLCNTQQCSTV